MVFPINFSRTNSDYNNDIYYITGIKSSVINLIGNGTVVAIGGLGLGLVNNVGLKALGFSKVTTTIATAIPVTIGAFGAAVPLTIAGAYIFFYNYHRTSQK